MKPRLKKWQQAATAIQIHLQNTAGGKGLTPGPLCSSSFKSKMFQANLDPEKRAFWKLSGEDETKVPCLSHHLLRNLLEETENKTLVPGDNAFESTFTSKFHVIAYVFNASTQKQKQAHL